MSPALMGCRGSSKIVNSSQLVCLQADHDASDESPSPKPRNVTQAYRALVSTEIEQRKELASLLSLRESSRILQDIEESVGTVSGSFNTLPSLASSIIDSLEKRHLTSGEQVHSDLFKAFAVFVWIAKNIEYDCKAWEDLLNQLPIPSTAPLSVLDTKRTVCSGYAALYTALATEVGLESTVIDGHFKISRALQPNGPLAEFYPSHLNTHAWNSVKLGDTWHLLDCTYAAGQAAESGFKKHFNRFYFAVPPEQLVLTHWPERADNQLLETPVPLELIQQLIPISPDAFLQDIELDEMMECITITSSSNQPVVDLALQSATKNHDIIAKLIEWHPSKASQPDDDSSQPPRCYIDCQRSQIRILAVVPARGIYTLKIFVQNASETTHLATYTIFCSVDSDRYIGYPRVDYSIANRFGFKLLYWNKETHIAECGTGELEIAFEASMHNKQIINFISPGPSDKVSSNSQYHFYSFLSQDRSNPNTYKLKILFPTEGLWTICVDVGNSLLTGDTECLMRYEVNVLQKTRGGSYPWIQSPGVTFLDSKPLHATGGEIFNVPFTIESPLDFHCYLARDMSSAEKLTQFVACTISEDDPYSHTLKVVFPEAGKWLVQVFGRPLNSSDSHTNQFCLYLEVENCLPQLIFPHIDATASTEFGIKFLDSPVKVTGPSFDVFFESPSLYFLQPCLREGWLDNYTFSSTHHCHICHDKASNRYRLRTTFPSSGRWTVLLFASLMPETDSECMLKFLYQAKVETSESDCHCFYPVLSPAFFQLKISTPSLHYNPLVNQDVFSYNLLSVQELEFKGVVHRPNSPSNALHHCVLLLPSSRQGCFYHHLQAVFPQDGDWMIQLFARAVNTSNYQPVVRLRVTSTVQVHDRLYPTIETTHFSRFQLKIDESKLPLLSKSSTIPTQFSLVIKQPASVELLHHARDQRGSLHTEATRLVSGERSSRKILLVELWESGDWTIQLFARMCNEKEWIPVLQHKINITITP